MNKYIPFLKLKRGEVKALYCLSEDSQKIITPLLEMPYDKKYTNELLKKRIDDIHKTMNKYLATSNIAFFLDNYDIDDKLKINDQDNYEYQLAVFGDYYIIPVIGLDRTKKHNAISVKYANTISDAIGIRLTTEFIKSIDAYISDLKTIDSAITRDVKRYVIIDCKLIKDSQLAGLVASINKLVNTLLSITQIEAFIISGSSLPNSVGLIVETNHEAYVDRNEVKLFSKIRESNPAINFIMGDYTTVSPDYSELNLDPRFLQNVMTARITYSTNKGHYITRGGSLKQNGHAQYFALARQVITKRFYRGENFSWGDNFLFQKANGIGPYVTPASIIAPCANSHMMLMINELCK